MNARLATAFVLVVFLAPAPAGAQETRRTRFKAVVEANFKHWDEDGDGKLSPQEINRLVRNHKVTGTEAAAVAAIHAFYRDHAKSSQLSKPVLMGTTGKSKKAFKDIDELFRDFRDHVRTAPRQVFVGDAMPSLRGMEQGDMGDCYFLCVVGACVHHRAHRVKEMFHPREDGSCEVVFLNGERTVVPKLTDAQIALGSSAGQQGLWLNVLEEAFGRVMFAKAPKKEKKARDLPVDLIARGGDSADAFPLMTGHRSKDFDFKEFKKPAALVQQKLRDALRYGAEHKLIMATSTPDKSNKMPAGIGDDHALAVLGYNAEADRVIVWDPNGHHHKPTGTPGLKHGYETKHGRYEVPVAEFTRIFCDVEWEILPAAKKK